MLSLCHVLLAFPTLVFSLSYYTIPPTSTISTQAQATSFVQSSPVFNGTVIINSSDTDTINLNGLTRIANSLIIENAANIKTVQSDTLTYIGGSFTLQNLTALTTISMPALTNMGIVSWQSLPLLTNALLPDETTKANSLSIVGTNLSSIPIITEPITYGYINLVNNPNILSISFPSLLSVGGFSVGNQNGPKVSVSLPNLANASSISVYNVSSLSIPALQSVSEEIVLDQTLMTTFSAPNLTDLSPADFYVSANPFLTTIDMPVLTSIRQLIVGSNVTTIYAPMLRQAVEIELRTSLVSASFAPNMTVNETILMTLNSNFDCNQFATAAGHPIVNQTFQCTSNLNSYYFGPPGSLSAGAKAGIGIGVFVFVLGVAAAVWLLCARRWRKNGRNLDKEMATSGQTAVSGDAAPSGETRTGRGNFFRSFGWTGRRT